jgi:hypothetical protein
MIVLPLSNDTKLEISVHLFQQRLVITQTPAASELPGIPPATPQIISIPFTDLKKLGESIKTLVAAFR